MCDKLKEEDAKNLLAIIAKRKSKEQEEIERREKEEEYAMAEKNSEWYKNAIESFVEHVKKAMEVNADYVDVAIWQGTHFGFANEKANVSSKTVWKLIEKIRAKGFSCELTYYWESTRYVRVNLH